MVDATLKAAPATRTTWVDWAALVTGAFPWLVMTVLTVVHLVGHPDGHCWPRLMEVVRVVVEAAALAVPAAVVLAVVALVRRAGAVLARLRSGSGVAAVLVVAFVVVFWLWPVPRNSLRTWYGFDDGACACPQPPFIYFQF